MRRALTGLSLLHGATLLALAWFYAGDEATLAADQRSFGGVMLGLAGALMLIGAGVVPRTPALAAVPFGLAGLLTLVPRTEGHAYLIAHGGWALALGALAVGVAGRARRQAQAPQPAPAPPPEPEPAPATPPEPDPAPGELAADVLLRIPRHREKPARDARRLDHRPRRDAPFAQPVTRPQPAMGAGARS